MAVTIDGAGEINGVVLPTTSFGKVLQVVSATYAITVSSTSATYADTGLSATITPSSVSSKILVIVSQSGVAKAGGNTGVGIRVLRTSTNIGNIGSAVAANGSTATNSIGSVSGTILDTPATTSAVTYKTQFANVSAAGTALVQADSDLSTITLMEISA